MNWFKFFGVYFLTLSLGWFFGAMGFTAAYDFGATLSQGVQVAVVSGAFGSSAIPMYIIYLGGES